MPDSTKRSPSALFGVALLVVAVGVLPRLAAAAGDAPIKLLERSTAIRYQGDFENGGLAAWRERVPEVELVRIPASSDGARQKALWYDSGSPQAKPLLVVLHTWGADYKQNLDIPFAEFAIENDWVFLHPDFRGPNVRPEATASDLAVRDVLDAVDYAQRQASVDESRVYLVGYSGGGMKALVLAGKHPDRWAGVAAWGAVYDLVDWYHHDGKKKHYNRQIADSCGGPPHPGTPAEAECRQRSPMSHLANAAGRVQVLIAHGLRDTTAPPRHAMSAFDALAAPEDRFTDEQRAHVDERGKLPEDLRGQADGSDPLFDSAGAPVALRRTSRTVTLVLFEGGHDMLYNASLAWLEKQRRR